MATVVTLNSPQQVLDYLNSITLPAVYDVIDKGGKYTVIDNIAGVYTITTVNDETELETALAAVTVLKAVVPKREGGKFTFVSVSDVVGGANAFLLKITRDQKELEEFLNTAITLEKIIEHDSKKLVIYT